MKNNDPKSWFLSSTDSQAGSGDPWLARTGLMTLGFLIVANISSLLDRSIMALLVGPIKADLDINDVQFGLLHGLAFALLYSVMGVPMGLLVDRFRRTRIVAAAVALWSVATGLCGAAQSFPSMFLARVGVGIGEAGLNPAAYSILSDCFPRRYLARAVGAFMVATYLGVGLSYVLGGLLLTAIDGAPYVDFPLLGEVRSWQAVFYLAALPGLLIATGFLFLPEPHRRGKTSRALSREGNSATGGGLKAFFLLNKQTLFFHFFGFVGAVAFANGLLLWTPTMLEQKFSMPMGQIGLEFGLLLVAFGGAGPYLGGWLADRLDSRGMASAPMKTALLFAVTALSLVLFLPLLDSKTVMYGVLGFLILVMGAQTALAITALQLVTPSDLRGQVSAIFLLVINIAGIGFGPVLVPLLMPLLGESADSMVLSVTVLGVLAFGVGAVSLFNGLQAYGESDRRMGFQ
jgi:MFS family permease